MSVRVHPLAMPELAALVNDWGTLPRQVGHRTAPGAVPGEARGADATVVVAVADRLHAVFATSDSAERVRLVNEMLAETTVRPDLTQDDGVLRAGWSVPEQRAVLLASAALALRDHLAAHPDRVGVCADRQCADIYVDASPAGHRRFCSPTCQTRTRVAAFRERRRRGSTTRDDDKDHR
jgi:predicted RNA-binding Zn ribbon-like protein